MVAVRHFLKSIGLLERESIFLVMTGAEHLRDNCRNKLDFSV